jgi:hypothetical protein
MSQKIFEIFSHADSCQETYIINWPSTVAEGKLLWK